MDKLSNETGQDLQEPFKSTCRKTISGKKDKLDKKLDKMGNFSASGWTRGVVKDHGPIQMQF